MLRCMSAEQHDAYLKKGWFVVDDLLTRDECTCFIRHMVLMDKEGTFAGRNPLTLHEHDPVMCAMMKKPRIKAILWDLMQTAPFGIQSMYLARAPGALGVCMHQDSYYIRNEPDTLHACWIALDVADAENGGLRVVTGTHCESILPVQSPRDASEHVRRTDVHQIVDRDGNETTQQIASGEVVVPDPRKIVSLSVKAGGAVFFNGHLIHGSNRNASAERWRRAVAFHYVGRETHVFRKELQNKAPI